MTLESSTTREAADFVHSRSETRPRVGFILGSGLGSIATSLAQTQTIPFSAIPHFPLSTAEGHQSELVLGSLSGQSVAVLRGRVHLYEGYTPAEVAFPVRFLRALGCEIVIVTNAAGGLNPAYMPGDLMLIRDHIFLAGMAGLSPIAGPHDPNLGPRFLDLSDAYDHTLCNLAAAAARHRDLTLHEGVYVMVAGPHFETPAEVRMLQSLGGDAVGMSTCPEVVAARQIGLRVLAISTITNTAGGHADGRLDHHEVLRVADEASARLLAVVEGTLSQLGP